MSEPQMKWSRAHYQKHPHLELYSTWSATNGCTVWQGRPYGNSTFVYRLEKPDGSTEDFRLLAEAKAAGRDPDGPRIKKGCSACREKDQQLEAAEARYTALQGRLRALPAYDFSFDPKYPQVEQVTLMVRVDDIVALLAASEGTQQEEKEEDQARGQTKGSL